MGKVSRRLSRRTRRRSARAGVQIGHDGGLKIVIATGPQMSDGGVSVHEDARLVRSALLYADKVELISPGALMIAAVAAAATQGTDFVFDLMGSLDDQTLQFIGYDGDSDEMRTALSTMRSLNLLSRDERREVLGPQKSRELRALVNDMTDRFLRGEQGFEAVAVRMWEQAGAPDLAVAVGAGLLTISTQAFDIGAESDLQMQQYVDTLTHLLANPSAHLMFDSQIASLSAAIMRESNTELHPLTADHAVRAAVGAGLIERLPAFPDADVEAIIATRRDLAEPLVRYRRGITHLAATLSSGPLDSALQAEVDDLWRAEVQPTLLALKDDLSATELVKDTALNLATDTKAVVAGTIGAGVFFGVGSLTNLATWSTLGLAAAPSVIQAAGRSVKDTQVARAAARTHDLYYLLAANDRLS